MSFIEDLQALIHDRKVNPKEDSYTNALLEDEEELVKKVGEEAIEVVLAALQQGPTRLVSETADLFYHMLVLLTAHDIQWEEVLEELRRRHQK